MIKKLVCRLVDRIHYAVHRSALKQEPVSAEVAEAVSAIHVVLSAMLARHERSDLTEALNQAIQYFGEERINFYTLIIGVLQGLASPGKNPRVMDIGTGFGGLLYMLSKRFPDWRLSGIEGKTHDAVVARCLCPSATIEVKSLWESNTSGDADIVLATEVLEHLVDPERAVGVLLSMAGKDGAVVLTVPDGRHDSMEAGEYYPGTRSYWGHINFWSPESWRIFVERHADGARAVTGCIGGDSLYAVLRRGVA